MLSVRSSLASCSTPVKTFFSHRVFRIKFYSLKMQRKKDLWVLFLWDPRKHPKLEIMLRSLNSKKIGFQCQFSSVKWDYNWRLQFWHFRIVGRYDEIKHTKHLIWYVAQSKFTVNINSHFHLSPFVHLLEKYLANSLQRILKRYRQHNLGMHFINY